MGWTRRRWTTARAGPTRDGGERDERDANEEANEEDATVERDSELTQGMVAVSYTHLTLPTILLV